MILTYGSYSHPDADVAVQMLKQASYSPQMRKDVVSMVAVASGRRLGDSASDLTASLEEMQEAYSQDGQDLIHYDNQSNETVHKLISLDSLYGTRVIMPPSYIGHELFKPNAEYATGRTFMLKVAAEYEDETQGELLEWRETVRGRGLGGPRFELSPGMVGPSLVQPTGTHSDCYYIQQGYAVGRTAFPYAFVPPPIWPFWLDNPNSSPPAETSPQRWGNGKWRVFRLDWSYAFKSPLPLAGTVNLPPLNH